MAEAKWGGLGLELKAKDWEYPFQKCSTLSYVWERPCTYVRVCTVYLPSRILWSSCPLLSWRASLKPSYRTPPPPPHPRTRWTHRATIFLGVRRGVSVYITQRILLKSCSPSVLNSGLISSLPSCRHAPRPLNGHSGCYGRLGSSYLPLPVGILLRPRRTQCLCSLENTHQQRTDDTKTWWARTVYETRNPSFDLLATRNVKWGV